MFPVTCIMAEKQCVMCERVRPLTFHHLIPKKTHKRGFAQRKYSKEQRNQSGIDVCTDCHRMIHKTLDHTQLAREYNTLERLLAHPDIDKFVRWVATQDKRAKLG